jgi:hypothetical protein
MAVASNQSASEFLFSPPCPQALKDWIEQDLGWKAQDLREIVVKFQELEGIYAKYGVLAKAFVTREYLGVYEEKSHQFLQFPNGNWHKFKGWMYGYGNDSVFPITDWQIVYTPDFETKVQKQELNDNDAFDLMDSIRDELWK